MAKRKEQVRRRRNEAAHFELDAMRRLAVAADRTGRKLRTIVYPGRAA